MQKVSCPSCGAEVTFRSAASVMAVCEYCRSTLIKDAESVKDIGKMSEVLEDYSPIQINTSGTYEGKHFTVVGRIQLRYDAGFWNEWYVVFDEGTNGWLSDASGQYIFTVSQGIAPGAPRFESLRSQTRYSFQASNFIATDVRTAQCIAGQGELPFRVGKGWQARVADFRSSNRFLTLDYSDSEEPQLYLGTAVTLEVLRCQLLRSSDDIAGTAGRFKGKTTALDCPNCGSGIQYQAGMAFHVVCPSCHADVDCSMEKALVLQKHEDLARVQTTLQLGDVGAINQVKYSIIGLMKCRELDPEESSEWVEYLLFNANQGFFWLVENDGAWDRVDVLNEWPELFEGDTVSFPGPKNKRFKKLYDYGSEVIYAAGAFNWRVSVGDKTTITDYSGAGEKLTAEYTDKEINLSLTKRISPQTVGQWFGKTLAAAAPSLDFGEIKQVNAKAAKVYSMLLAGLNLPIACSSGKAGIWIVLIGLVLIWVPVLFSNRISDE